MPEQKQQKNAFFSTKNLIIKEEKKKEKKNYGVEKKKIRIWKKGDHVKENPSSDGSQLISSMGSTLELSLISFRFPSQHGQH